MSHDCLFSHAQESDVNEERMLERGEGSGEKKSVGSDELSEIPLARRGCLPLVIGSEFDGYRLSQNLGVGQKGWDNRNILGIGSTRREW
jgi:hypothetical protein